MNFVKGQLSIYRPEVLATPMLIISHVKSVNHIRINGNQIHVDYLHCEKNLIQMKCTAIHHVHMMVHAPIHALAFKQIIIVKNSVAATINKMIARFVLVVASAKERAIQTFVHAILENVNVIRICVIVVLNKSMQQTYPVKMYAFNASSVSIY